ncbi:MAG: hypothetical protein K2P21_02045, partial [Lachnospiraceae bacterium]|nr:hypothetical protein [Lachnospiraceae bacterium]
YVCKGLKIGKAAEKEGGPGSRPAFGRAAPRLRNSLAYGFTVTESSPFKFAVRKGLDSLAEFTHFHGLCSRCKVLG